MNFGNESSTTGPEVVQPQTKLRYATLRPEEIAMFKDCSRELFYTIGIPFAVAGEIVATYFFKKPGVDQLAPQALFFRGLRFLGNVFLGRFLGTPICYNKLKAMRTEFLQNHPEFENQTVIQPERAQPVTQSKDLGYPPQVPNLDDLESSFSSDFTQSKLISDDPEQVKTSKTTYEELRARHRSGWEGYKRATNLQSGPPKPGISSAPDEKPLFDESPPSSPPPPPQRIVKKTKYGDEME